MEKVTSLVGPFDRSVLAVGWCSDDRGMTAMAWASDDGFEWRRVLDREPNAMAAGASTDGLGSAVIVGTREDSVPLVWEPNRRRDAFNVSELPTEDGLETWADRVARGLNSFMVVGNSYPNGIEGNTRPVAWVKIVDETEWVMVEPPPDADQFVDVAENSVFRDGTVGLARTFGQQGFVGDRYTVLGYTKNSEPAVWQYTLDGNWETTLLPDDTDDNYLRELIGSRVALSWEVIWIQEGGEWTATNLTEDLFAAYAGVRLDVGGIDAGLLVTGIQWAADGEYPYTVFLNAPEDDHWIALPDQPQYHDFPLVDSLAALDDRVIAISEKQVFMGPIPAP